MLGEHRHMPQQFVQALVLFEAVPIHAELLRPVLGEPLRGRQVEAVRNVGSGDTRFLEPRAEFPQILSTVEALQYFSAQAKNPRAVGPGAGETHQLVIALHLRRRPKRRGIQSPHELEPPALELGAELKADRLRPVEVARHAGHGAYRLWNARTVYSTRWSRSFARRASRNPCIQAGRCAGGA